MRHLINIKDLSTAEILSIVDRSIVLRNLDQKSDIKNKPNHQINKAEQGPIFLSKNLIACNLFLENSTRTRLSFEVAQKKLGIHSIDFKAEQSSLQKGESYYDTLKTIESLGCHICVVRSSLDSYLQKYSEQLNMILINAGESKNEHPSQCLLDLAVMQLEFSRLEGLKVLIVGDSMHSRVFSSHWKIAQSLGIDLYVSGPKDFIHPEAIHKYIDIDQACQQMDVLMFLRHQSERHANPKAFNSENYLQSFGMNMDRYQHMQKHAIIMHPGPFHRDLEIASELVESPKSRIFLQKNMGVFTRMALLEFLIKENYE